MGVVELLVEAAAETGADLEEAGLESAGRAVDLAGVFIEGDAFAVALLDEFAVMRAEFREADFKRAVGGVVIEGVLLFLGLGGEDFGEVLAEHQPAVALEFLALVHDVVAGDREGPGFEIRADFEVVLLCPERDVGFLKDVAGSGETRHGRADVGQDGPLMGRQQAYEFLISVVRVHLFRMSSHGVRFTDIRRK